MILCGAEGEVLLMIPLKGRYRVNDIQPVHALQKGITAIVESALPLPSLDFIFVHVPN